MQYVPSTMKGTNLNPAFLVVFSRCSVRRIGPLPDVMAPALAASTGIHIDDEGKCVFGKKSYWDTMYSSEKGIDGRSSERYSWYCTYEEFSPFWRMLVPGKASRIMIAGIGNDPSPVAMYDDGYEDMLAFDYSEEGVERAKRLFGPGRDKARLITADARDLPLPEASIDATLDKGTLDAIYITGEDVFVDTIKEITRVTALDGILMCISSVILADDLMAAFDDNYWKNVHDGNLAFSPDGEATIDLGADLYSWKRTNVAFEEHKGTK